jgi:hypothetical protein
MKIVTASEKQLLEAPDEEVALADSHAPNREDVIARREDALALDPYSPITPTS